MVARSVLAALGTAAVAAASQSLAAAAAPASAIFQQSLRGNGYSFLRAENDVSTLTALSGDDSTNCTKEINELRTKLGFTDPGYSDVESEAAKTAIEKIATLNLSCASVASGKFPRLHEDLFLFSFPEAAGDGSAAAACKNLIDQTKEGFFEYDTMVPPKYEDPSDFEDGSLYSKPKAVGFLSMLLTGPQNIYCGVPGPCNTVYTEEEKKPLLCFISNENIADKMPQLTVEAWRTATLGMGVKMPEFKEESAKYIDAMNKFRQDSALELEDFTELTDGGNYDNDFKLMTCDDIHSLDSVTLYSTDAYTFIYATKDGDAPLTPDEAVEIWKGGFKDLQSASSLPAFAKTYKDEAKVYKNSAVAGFVSLMTKASRKVKCQTATSCSPGKSAVICVFVGATLVDGQQPIEAATWEKLQGSTKAKQPSLAAIAEDSELLKEINAYRTSEALGLGELKASAASDESEGPQQSELLKAVTCEALESSSVAQVAADSSLLYIVGSDAENLPSGAEALAQLKQGFAKFEKTLPAEYTAESELYKDAAAVNFISLVSDKVQTADCYAATGCSKQAIICQLSPPALAENKAPLEQATWDKVVAAAAADPAAGSSTSGSSSSALSAFAAALAFAAAVPFF